MEGPGEQPGSPHAQQRYSLPGLEGEWTLEQLVEMELGRDRRLKAVRSTAGGVAGRPPPPLLAAGWHRGWPKARAFSLATPSSPLCIPQVRRSALPPEFWEARRTARNRARLQRHHATRLQRGEAARQQEADLLAGMSKVEQAAYLAQREAAREAAKAAAAEQRARVAAAMEAGPRIVVDCSFSTALPPPAAAGAGTGIGNDAAAPGGSEDSSEGGSEGSDAATPSAAATAREVRSLCKQLQMCAAANKRASRPVNLHFASFNGEVRRFALEGMGAAGWPAARGHAEPLPDLFPVDSLVVLSPDAEEPLLGGLEKDKVGGCLGWGEAALGWAWCLR